MVSQGPPKAQKWKLSGVLKAQSKTDMLSFLLHSVGYSMSPTQPRFGTEELYKDMKTWSQCCNMKISVISIDDRVISTANATMVCYLDS